MLTYQLQPRFYKSDIITKFEFPNNVEIQITLEPKEAFGVGAEPSRTCVQNRPASTLYNANTGKGTILSKPPLEEVEAILTYTNDPDFEFKQIGNVITIKFNCENYELFKNQIDKYHYLLPIIYNVFMQEPIIVINTRGKVGDIKFNLEFKESQIHFNVITHIRPPAVKRHRGTWKRNSDFIS